MSMLHLDDKNALNYRYQPPPGEKGCTFVFFNALTGDAASWEAVIVPKLVEHGHGALVYNLRGQPGSPFTSDLILDDKLIASDAVRLLTEVKPIQPIFVGLSIGGLFAARTYLAGAEAIGLVLVNTLRRQSVRLSWINDALVRSVEIGGLELLKDFYLPLLRCIKATGPLYVFGSNAQTPIQSTVIKIFRTCHHQPPGCHRRAKAADQGEDPPLHFGLNRRLKNRMHRTIDHRNHGGGEEGTYYPQPKEV